MIGDDVCTPPVLGREQGCKVPVSGQGGQHNNFAFLLLKSNLQNKQPNLSPSGQGHSKASSLPHPHHLTK